MILGVRKEENECVKEREKDHQSTEHKAKSTLFPGTGEGSRSHYNHDKFSANYKSQARIHPLLWLLSCGQYGQSLSVMCRPMNLVPLWGEKQNQSNPSNQQSARDPSARASYVPLQKVLRLVKSGC